MRLIVLLLVLLTGLTLGAASDAPGSSATAFRTRSCGTLSIGIGWHLRASPNVRCLSARQLMVTYFSRRANRGTRAVVLGYHCTKRDLRDAEHIRCARAQIGDREVLPLLTLVSTFGRPSPERSEAGLLQGGGLHPEVSRLTLRRVSEHTRCPMLFLKREVPRHRMMTLPPLVFCASLRSTSDS